MLIGSITYYQRCRDVDLQHLLWRVMAILGCNNDVCEHWFWDHHVELGGKRPIDIFEEGHNDERIIELARATAGRRYATPDPEPTPPKRPRVRHGRTDQ